MKKKLDVFVVFVFVFVFGVLISIIIYGGNDFDLECFVNFVGMQFSDYDSQ